MNLFPKKSDHEQLNPFDGVFLSPVAGEKMTLMVADVEPNSVVPMHSHPHEQVGIVVSGTIEFVVGDEKKLLKTDDFYIIPGDVPHEARTFEEGARLVEGFSPAREDLRR